MAKFKDKNMLEISPIVTSEDEIEVDKKSSTLQREILANENKEYNVPFEWGLQGQVEIRSVK